MFFALISAFLCDNSRNITRIDFKFYTEVYISLKQTSVEYRPYIVITD